MNRKVIVRIDPLGRPQIEAVGFNGIGCTEATQAIEAALAGSGGVDRVIKPEWFSHSETAEHEQETQW